MERDADLASIAAAIDAQADNAFLLGTGDEFSATEKKRFDRAVLHLERAVEALAQHEEATSDSTRGVSPKGSRPASDLEAAMEQILKPLCWATEAAEVALRQHAEDDTLNPGVAEIVGLAVGECYWTTYEELIELVRRA